MSFIVLTYEPESLYVLYLAYAHPIVVLKGNRMI